MIFYFGQELLEQVGTHYSERLETAKQKGLAEEDSTYHWLYQELQLRVTLLRQARLFMDALPLFMTREAPETVLGYVTLYVSAWFKEQNIGKLPSDSSGHCRYFCEENPYWAAISEVMSCLESATDFQVKPLFYLNLCEYVIRNVRLYFYLREKQYRAIDRDHFDALMGLEPGIAISA